jgi:hypothetical protein
MLQHSRGHRAILLSAALLVAALAAAPSADAASSKRCKALAGKMTILAKGPDSMVVKRGSSEKFTLTYYGCLYVKPRLVKLPGQNGGDTEHFDKFTLNGRYLAYGHVNAEPAAGHVPGWIELLDLQRRKRIFQYDAFPVGPQDEESTGVLQILLRADGAVAWIGYKYGAPDTYSVQTAVPGQVTPAEVDQGIYVGRTSLRSVPDNPAAFSWRGRDGRQSAIFGGPTVTGQQGRR